MAKVRTVLQVLLASPSDVSEERQLAESVVEEFNRTWGDSLGLQLELLKWETHAFSDTAGDPQQAINRQLGQEYDFFVGILWSRFGTRTPRAESGTQEEFESALRRFHENPNSVRILFYFKETPLSPIHIVPTQIAAIQQFRSGLGGQGTLYWVFETVDEFGQLLRIHLSRQVQEWLSSHAVTSAQSNLVSRPATVATGIADVQQVSEGEEEGYFDLIAAGEEDFATMVSALDRMTVALNDLNSRTEQRTSELVALKGSRIPSTKMVKTVFDRAATDLNEFTSRTEPEIEIFSHSYNEGVRSFSAAISMLEFQETVPESEIQSAMEKVLEMADNTKGAREKVGSFREMLSTFPRFTTAHNRARKRAVATVDRLLLELSTSENIARELAKSLARMLKRKPTHED